MDCKKKISLILLLLTYFLQVACASQPVSTTDAAGGFSNREKADLTDARAECFTEHHSVRQEYGGNLMLEEESCLTDESNDKSSTLNKVEDGNNDKKANILKDTPPMCSGSILVTFQEISVPSYQKLYGQQHFMSDQVVSISERIARIKINSDLFNQERIKVGDRLWLDVFDDKKIVLSVKNIIQSSDSLTISGVVESTNSSFMALSITDNQVLASIKINDSNIFYLIKYNPISSEHYLYRSPMDQIDIMEEDKVMIPDIL